MVVDAVSDGLCTDGAVRRLLLVGAGRPVRRLSPEARALDLVVTGSAYSWSLNRSKIVFKRFVHKFRLLCTSQQVHFDGINALSVIGGI